MNKKIDRESAVAMAKMGFTQREIAQRLGCSRKQINRILREQTIGAPIAEKLNDPEVETALRTVLLQFESGQSVAERFGVSRQAILKLGGSNV